MKFITEKKMTVRIFENGQPYQEKTIELGVDYPNGLMIEICGSRTIICLTPDQAREVSGYIADALSEDVA